MSRYPIRDQVAIVGLGSTGFSRDAGGRSSKALACDASIRAIRDAGLEAKDIDGVVGPLEPGGPGPQGMAAALGLPQVTHHSSPMPVAIFGLTSAMNAVFSGACDTVLLYFAYQRLPWNSRSAASDPFRGRFQMGGAMPVPEPRSPVFSRAFCHGSLSTDI